MKTVQNVKTIGKNTTYKHHSNVLPQTTGLVPKTNHNADERSEPSTTKMLTNIRQWMENGWWIALRAVIKLTQYTGYQPTVLDQLGPVAMTKRKLKCYSFNNPLIRAHRREEYHMQQGSECIKTALEDDCRVVTVQGNQTNIIKYH